MREKNEADQFLRSFLTFWALAHIFHAQFGLWLWEQSSFLCFLALLEFALALFVLLRPSLHSAFLLSCTQLLNAAVSLPDIPNHWLLVSFINVGLLLAIVLSRGSEKLCTNTIRTLAPVSLALIYLFSFVWKLNPDYFALDTSCATYFYSRIEKLVTRLPEPESLGVVPVWGSLLLEAVLVPGLLWRPSRKYAAFLACLFHGFLSLDTKQQFLNFSAVMYALLFCCVADELLAYWKSLQYKKWNLILLQSLKWLYAFLFVTLAFLSLFSLRGDVFWILSRQLLWLVFCTFCLILLLRMIVFGSRVKTGASLEGLSRVPVLVSVLLIVLNGLAPITGLKTGSSWQMYSNVSLIKGEENHFFLSSLDLFGVLSKRVEIVAEGKSNFRAPTKMPFYHLARSCELQDCSGLQFQEGGFVSSYHPSQARKYLETFPWLFRKLARFTSTGESAAQQCQW